MWRNAGLEPAIFGLDARCLLPFVVFIFKANTFTFVFAIIGVILSSLMVYKGYSISTALLAIKTWLAGSQRTTESKYGFTSRKYVEDDLFRYGDTSCLK